MNKLDLLFQVRVISDFLFDEILDRLDVMVGGAFYGLHTFSVFERKVADDFVQQIICGITESWCFRNVGVGCELLKPANFDLNAILDEGVFTETVAQGFSFATIAPVHR